MVKVTVPVRRLQKQVESLCKQIRSVGGGSRLQCGAGRLKRITASARQQQKEQNNHAHRTSCRTSSRDA